MLISVWVDISILWFLLTIVLLIGLRNAFKFRFTPAMKARQRYAQSIMMILCYITGVGWSVGALTLIWEKGVEKELKAPFMLVLWMTFGNFASFDIYFYRVWILYYKYKLQNEFERVGSTSDTQKKSSILSHIRALTSNSRTNMLKLDDNSGEEPRENLIKWRREQSVRKSWFVRYRYILGRSMVTKAFWFIFWICECIVAFWTYKTHESNVW
jgi:hypothetical protein